MTGSELYLMLNLIADKVAMATDEIRQQLPYDMERENEWWDKTRNVQISKYFFDPGSDKIEQRPTGDFLILESLVRAEKQIRSYSREMLDK